MTRRPFGNVRQLPSGRWLARWMGPDGYHHRAPSTFLTRDAGEAWLRETKVELDKGTLIDERGGAIAFADYSAEWTSTVVDLRRSTLVRDLDYLERYVIPEFGPTPIGEIKTAAVREWVTSLTTDAELAPATVTKAKQILTKILAQAVDDGRIGANPCAGVKVPRVERIDMNRLTPGQILELADAIDPRYRELVLLGCWTGLRIGELVALTPADIDVVHRQVSVTKIVTEVSGHFEFGPPKTKAGRRVVPIVPWVADELTEYLDGKHTDDIAFPAPEGGYLRLSNFRFKTWRAATKAIGEPGLRVHDMRHTAISIWVASNLYDPVKIAKWAGHTSVVTLLDRYAHVDPDANLDALDAIGRPRRKATISRIR